MSCDYFGHAFLIGSCKYVAGKLQDFLDSPNSTTNEEAYELGRLMVILEMAYESAELPTQIEEKP
jgi:hypothetical protein